MYKALAVLRTVFLVFVTGYTIRAMPFFSSVPRTLDEQYARCAATIDPLIRAAWYAVAWIALETVVGWLLLRKKAKPAPAAAPGTGVGADTRPPRAGAP